MTRFRFGQKVSYFGNRATVFGPHAEFPNPLEIQIAIYPDGLILVLTKDLKKGWRKA